MRRVAVTGLGVISPSGNSAGELFGNMMAAKSGVKRIAAAYAEKLIVKIAAEVDFDPIFFFSKKMVSLDRTSQMALAAALQAWDDSGIVLDGEEKNRSGVFMGTGQGGAQSLDEICIQLYR